ncbi:hypothetical protein INR49_005948 [Caranx melampygus]|nr:hypothetical protein INR49_005948 [Caranx melampygus]
MTVSNGQTPACEEQHVFLRDDREFRDKITPISVAMEYTLDYQQAADLTGLLPILGMTAPSNVTKQAHILLDCGDDNICKPDLKLSVKRSDTSARLITEGQIFDVGRYHSVCFGCHSDRDQIYIGDDNALTLEISAENQGEGAYEAELHVYPPQQADFTGVVRSQVGPHRPGPPRDLVLPETCSTQTWSTQTWSSQRPGPHRPGPPRDLLHTDLVHTDLVLSRLSCAYKKENQTKMVVCDLGNPMKGGTKVLAELRFSVHQLSEEDTSVKFDLQIVSLCLTCFSSNQFDNTSPRVSSVTKLAVLAKVSIRGSSSPGQVLLPIANWKPKEPPVVGDDIGPQIVHVYENPLTVQKNTSVVPPRERETEGRNRNHVRKRDLESRDGPNDLQTLDCTTASCLRLKCQVGRLERRKNAILFIYSRLATENQNRSYVVRSTASFSVIEMPYKNLMPELPSNSTTVSVSVMWVAEVPQPVPGWVVALAVLAGLLLLALLIFIMYKLGFFKRVRPPQEDCTEKEQLQPEENGNTDA